MSESIPLGEQVKIPPPESTSHHEKTDKTEEIREKIFQNLIREYIPHPLDHPKVKVQQIQNLGRAVFAQENIPAGETIAAFVGTIHTAKKISDLPNDPPDFMRDHVIQIGHEEYLHGKGGLAELINHSCAPNCGIKESSKVVTMRDIKAGEQLTWDYAMTEDSDWYFPGCLCGSDECRGTIGPYRDLPEKTKKKYQHFTSEWLQKKYSLLEPERFEFQNLTSESAELTPELIKELADAFRLAFNNPPYNQYLFYPSEGRPIPPSEVFGLDPSDQVDLSQLYSLDLEKYPPHPVTGEKAMWWTDQEITEKRFQKKLKSGTFMTIVRDPETSSIVGATFARECTVREAFEEEEWKNPFYYSKLTDEKHFRKFAPFREKIQEFAKKEFGTPEMTAETKVLCYNCVFIRPELQKSGLFLHLVQQFLRSLPEKIKHLHTLSEMIIGTKAHTIYTACGMHPISGIFNPENQLEPGDAVIAISRLDELIKNFNVPRDQFREMIKGKRPTT